MKKVKNEQAENIKVMESPPGHRVVINSREVDYFCGTGYLGLHGHPLLIKAAQEALSKYGIGPGTSRSGFGNNPVLLEVEEKAARFFGTEKALYFASGYLGNWILLKSMQDRFDIIFADDESHYSILDAANMTNKPLVSFKHRDAGDLKEKIAGNLKPSQRPLLVCDGIFPISGEISPLSDYFQVLEHYDRAVICIDDAHAIGILGNKGRGTREFFNLDADWIYSSGTFSKAFGGYGGIITRDAGFIQLLREKSGIPDGSSPVPTAAAAATAKALELVEKNPGIRKTLASNVSYLKGKLCNIGFTIDHTPVPIICLHGKDINMKRIQEKLMEEGVVVHYLKEGSYTNIPMGGSIRIAVFSTHTRSQLDHLANCLQKFC
jgi:glycine C-acetyltransferase/8-amino-7-oxononanoate synthase